MDKHSDKNLEMLIKSIQDAICARSRSLAEFIVGCLLANDVVRRGSEDISKIFQEIEYLIWQYDTRPASDLLEEIADRKKKYIQD